MILILTEEEADCIHHALVRQAAHHREQKARWLKIVENRERSGNASAVSAYKRFADSSKKAEVENITIADKISALQDVTKPFAWIIDQDQSDSPWTQAGEIGPRGAAKAAVDVLREGGGQRFRLLNGDGDVSYEGRIVMCKADDRPGFQPLTAFKWCAAIQYLDAAGDTWVTM